jgi:carbonic anhydrase
MEQSRITPDHAIEMLKQGNARYVDNTAQNPNRDQARRALTSNGQHPFATFLSCSDSRVPVEMLCDAGIGDIFLVRNAGNVVGENELGSIEYSVDHWGVAALVVMGHSKCGACKAVYDEGKLDGHLRGISEHIFPAVEEAKKKSQEMADDMIVNYATKAKVWRFIEASIPAIKGKTIEDAEKAGLWKAIETAVKPSDDEIVNAAVKANVWNSIEKALRSSESIRKRVTSGDLKVVGAFYDIESGKIDVMGTHPKQSQLLG